MQLDVREAALVFQMRGWNHIRLSPRDPCHDICPELTFRLEEGEIRKSPLS